MRCPDYAGLKEQMFGAVDGVKGDFGSLFLADHPNVFALVIGACVCVGGGGDHIKTICIGFD